MKKYVASPQPRGEFLLPRQLDGAWDLVGEKSGRTYPRGMVVYVGREVTENDVFARAVNAGHHVESVEALLGAIRGLLRAAASTKVGGSVELTREGDARAV